MNVYVAQNSSAERVFRAQAGIPGLEPKVRVPEIPASPEHDLLFHGGQTISDLAFHNFYVGGNPSWKNSDVRSIDQALASATHYRNVKPSPLRAWLRRAHFLPSLELRRNVPVEGVLHRVPQDQPFQTSLAGCEP
jgi:hypothetical protein